MDRPFNFQLFNYRGFGDFLTLSQDNLIDIGLRVNTHYLLDGLNTENNNPSIFNISYDVPRAIRYDLNLPVGICRGPAVHFDNFWYDPTFSSIFTGQNGLGAPISTKQKKDNKTLAIAVGVSIGCVVVVGAIVIVLAIKVPAFKALIRPFIARKHASVRDPSQVARPTSGATSAPSSGAWVASSTPPRLS